MFTSFIRWNYNKYYYSTNLPMKQFSILVGYQPIFRENIIIQSSDWKIEKKLFQFNTTLVGTSTCTWRISNFKGNLTIVPSHLFFEFWKVGSSNQSDYDLLAKFLHKFLHFWGDYLNKIWNRERCWDSAFCPNLCTSTGSLLKYNVTIYTLF